MGVFNAEPIAVLLTPNQKLIFCIKRRKTMWE